MNKVLLAVILTSLVTAQSTNLKNGTLNEAIPIMVSKEACLDYRIRYPWKETTSLTFEIPSYALVNISIYSIKGKYISNLTNEYMKPGKNSVTWNGRDSNGKLVKHDVYFHVCRLDK